MLSQLPAHRPKTRLACALGLAVTLSAGLGLSGCDRISQYIGKGAGSGGDSAPPVEKFTYKVDVHFDDESKKLMAEKGIALEIYAAYYGTPKNEAARAEADEGGHIALGNDTRHLDGRDQTLTVVPHGLNRDQIKNVKGAAPHMLVKAYSQTEPGKGRLIDCNSFDGNLVKAAGGSAIKINCHLVLLGRPQADPLSPDADGASEE